MWRHRPFRPKRATADSQSPGRRLGVLGLDVRTPQLRYRPDVSIPESAQSADVAAKMRQVAFDAGLVRNDAATPLATAVLSNRPWQEEDEFAAALRRWATQHWGEGSLDPGLADGAGEVAAELAVIGRATNPPSDAQAVGIVNLMLQNVGRARAAREYDTLRDHIKGVPERTLRRYRQLAREAGDDPGLDALPIYFASLQYRLDLDAMVNAGRTEAAARRWLERHPGKHASDAPAPRRKGASAFAADSGGTVLPPPCPLQFQFNA